MKARAISTGVIGVVTLVAATGCGGSTSGGASPTPTPSPTAIESVKVLANPKNCDAQPHRDCRKDHVHGNLDGGHPYFGQPLRSAGWRLHETARADWSAQAERDPNHGGRPGPKVLMRSRAGLKCWSRASASRRSNRTHSWAAAGHLLNLVRLSSGSRGATAPELPASNINPPPVSGRRCGHAAANGQSHFATKPIQEEPCRSPAEALSWSTARVPHSVALAPRASSQRPALTTSSSRSFGNCCDATPISPRTASKKSPSRRPLRSAIRA